MEAGTAHLQAGQVTNKETQGQDFREALQGQGVCLEWKNTKLILAIQRENGEKKLHKRIEISTEIDKKADATGVNHSQHISSAQEQP